MIRGNEHNGHNGHNRQNGLVNGTIAQPRTRPIPLRGYSPSHKKRFPQPRIHPSLREADPKVRHFF